MKKCEYCGKEFEPRRKNRKYCCDNCHAEAQSIRQKQYYAQKKAERGNIKLCVICGKEFEAKVWQQKYCSEECAHKAAMENQRQARASARISEETKPKQKEITAISSASRRFYKMSLREISAECARFHISYGTASLMAQNGTLPEEWGKG